MNAYQPRPICGSIEAMAPKLKELMDRVGAWPEEMQEEAVDVLLLLEHAHTASYLLTDADRAALARSAEDVRHGRFVPTAQIADLFERNRRA